MHLNWRDYESFAARGAGAWRDFVRYPHLLVCAQCRREMKEHRINGILLREVKAAYLRSEEVHREMVTRGGSRRA